jgi:hypothetical protein
MQGGCLLATDCRSTPTCPSSCPSTVANTRTTPSTTPACRQGTRLLSCACRAFHSLAACLTCLPAPVAVNQWLPRMACISLPSCMHPHLPSPSHFQVQVRITTSPAMRLATASAEQATEEAVPEAIAPAAAAAKQTPRGRRKVAAGPSTSSGEPS